MENFTLKIGRFALAGYLVLLWPAAAYAQLTAPREAPPIQLGPVDVYPTLQIADAGKDSNVFEDAQDPKSDYTLTVQSRVLTVTKLGLNELMFSTGGDYLWFRQYKQEQSSDGQYAMRFNLSASRFKPFIGAGRTRTRTRPTTEIDLRARRLERSVVVGSNFDLTQRTAITATAQIDDSAYERGQLFRGVDLADALSRSRTTYSGGVRYAVTPLTTMAITGSYENAVFRRSHLRDSKIYRVETTLEFSPDAALRGRFSAGMQMFKPVDSELAEYKGPTFLAGLNWSLSDVTTFNVVATRNVNNSYKDTEPYYLLTGGRVTVTQKLIGAFDVQATADRQYLSYRWRRGIAPSSSLEDDVTDTVGGGVGINMRRGFKLLLTAERTRRHSNVDTSLHYERTRLLSTVTIGS
jgi:hypothetical protein